MTKTFIPTQDNEQSQSEAELRFALCKEKSLREVAHWVLNNKLNIFTTRHKPSIGKDSLTLWCGDGRCWNVEIMPLTGRKCCRARQLRIDAITFGCLEQPRRGGDVSIGSRACGSDILELCGEPNSLFAVAFGSMEHWCRENSYAVGRRGPHPYQKLYWIVSDALGGPLWTCQCNQGVEQCRHGCLSVEMLSCASEGGQSGQIFVCVTFATFLIE